jgi:sugar lactone lactonase YvrE
MKLLEPSPPTTSEPLPPPTEVIIPEARKRGRRRRLWLGILVAVALAAAGALGGVIGNGGSRVHTPVLGGGPQDGAVSSSHLYTVTNSMAWTGGGLVTASTRALYALDFATGLMRVQIDPFRVTAKTSLSGFPDSPFDVNVAAYGLGALWAAAGDLVRLNPTTLTVTARFTLPEPALVVLVAGGMLWVGTPTNLLAVDPATGAVVHVDPLGYRPAAMAVSPKGRTLYPSLSE